MDWGELVERGARRGASEPELMVLAVVRYRPPMPPRDMPGWALREFETLRTTYARSDLEAAVASCLGRGWLRVVTEADAAGEPPAWSTFAAYTGHSVGVMDFTPEGHALAVQLWGAGRGGATEGVRPRRNAPRLS